MIIALPCGSRITLSTKSDSAGGALTVTAPGGVAKPVAFGQQLRALLRPLGAEAASVHLQTLTEWCRIALDRDGRVGIKATKRNRGNWKRSLAMIETALGAGSPAPLGAAVRFSVVSGPCAAAGGRNEGGDA